MLSFDAPMVMLQSGHGHPIYIHVYQDTYPIAVICLGAAALIAILWGLCEILE